jgi:uncharacterized protein YciI
VRLAYFYLMTSDASRIRAVAPAHAAYWRDLQLPGYSGGPFQDRSGGLILFDAPDLEAAQALVASDPFVRHGLVTQQWLKAWLVDEPMPGGS